MAPAPEIQPFLVRDFASADVVAAAAVRAPRFRLGAGVASDAFRPSPAALAKAERAAA